MPISTPSKSSRINSNLKNSSITRALSDNLKKKSVEQNHHILKALLTTTSKAGIKNFNRLEKLELDNTEKTYTIDKKLDAENDEIDSSSAFKVIIRQESDLHSHESIFQIFETF